MLFAKPNLFKLEKKVLVTGVKERRSGRKTQNGPAGPAKSAQRPPWPLLARPKNAKWPFGSSGQSRKLQIDQRVVLLHVPQTVGPDLLQVSRKSGSTFPSLNKLGPILFAGIKQKVGLTGGPLAWPGQPEGPRPGRAGPLRILARQTSTCTAI